MKTILGLFALLFLTVLGVIYMRNLPKGSLFSFSPKTPNIIIDNHTFFVTEAKSQKDKEIGLSNTASLPQGNGMLFIFDTPGYYPFWMKNVKYSLDIIYIYKNTIVTIIDKAPPIISLDDKLSIYKPDSVSDMVLEINGGLSQKYNFKKGDAVKVTL